MQQIKQYPRKIRGVLVIVISSFVLVSAMLIQPLGLSAVRQDQPEQASDPQNTTSVSGVSVYAFDAIEFFSDEPEFYSRSRQDNDSQITLDPDRYDAFSGDYDPSYIDITLPDDYNPVDEDEPLVLEPPVKPQGLMYTDTEFTLYVKANTLNLRAGPSLDTTILATLSFGDTVLCVGENDEWMMVRYEGQVGFLKSEFTSAEMVFRSVSEAVYVNANTLNLREGPSTSDDVITTLGRNDRLTRTGVGIGWSRVKTSSGKTGYVASDYLTKTAPVVRSSSGSTSSSGTVYKGDAGKIVDLAYQALGVRYRYSGHSLSGMDCSGLVYWAYKQIGITVPRTSSSYANAGVGVSYSNIRPGDVIAWDTRTRDGRTSITHVGIYVGSGKMIHASSRLGRVVVQSVREYQSWGCKIITIRRFISN